MKRTLFIVIGVLIILILIGVWAYFLFFGTPNQEGGMFTDFEFGNTDDESVVLLPVEPEVTPPVVDFTSPERLRQLTTRLVAGFAEVQLTQDSNPEFRYIELGTGHIYNINLETGTETRVSATTIPLANKGVITPNGQYMLIQAGSGSSAEAIIGILSTTSDELRNFAVPEQITSFTATVENEILYTTPVGNQLIASAYDPSNNTQRDLFTIPFRDATISWHASTNGPHVVYPRAASQLEGYVYTYTNGVATREAASGYGVSAVGSNEALLYSEQLDGEYRTFTQPAGSLNTQEIPLTIVPEKCVFTPIDQSISVCGVALTTYSNLMPDPWYKGELALSDNLWEINTTTGVANFLVSPTNATGREIDVINPAFGINPTNMYFQNKRDQSVWVYDYDLFENNPIDNIEQ